jgi:hypothetical protein
MKESRVLRVTPIPPRVDNRLLVDVEYSCSSCEGSGVVRLTAVDWMDGKDLARTNYKCAKCRGVVLKLIRPAKGKKMTNFELLENAGFKEISEIPYSWWVHLGLRLGFSFGGVRDANPAWLEDRIKRAGPEDEFLFFTTLADGATAELYDRILTTLGLEDLLPLPQKIEIE